MDLVIRLCLTAISLVIATNLAATASAEAPASAPESAAAAPLNWPLPTLGGEQFWSDELVYHGWRIQQNAVTGHYRLLDAHDIRRAWGTREQCQAAFESFKLQAMLPPLDGRAVITLHGLGRSRDHMHGIGQYLAQRGGFHWVNVSYASTRRSLDEHAQSLARVIEGLEGIDEISFVCHSLGNLVVRHYLGEKDQPQPRWQPDPRLKRMVMLGPPNNGAQLAVKLKDSELLAIIFGPSAKQLARQWNETQTLLATPAFPFGIVAGGCGDPRGTNPFVKGDDDAIVAVEETRLVGACDFRLVNCWHGPMVDNPTVRQLVLQFLEHGHFTSERERQPIECVPTVAKTIETP